MFKLFRKIFCKCILAFLVSFFFFILPTRADHTVFQYLDENKDLTIHQVLSSAQDFQNVSNPVSINHSFNAGNLWIRIKLQDDNTENLVIENAHLDTITCYFTRGDQILQTYFTGDRFRFSNRPINSNYFIFHIPADATGVFLKINTEGSLSVPLHLFNDEQIIPYLLRENSITLVYFGVALVILILNLLLYIRLRESLYFYYLLSVLAASIMIATNEGYMFKWFWPQTPVLNKYIVVLYSLSAFLFLFSEKFLNLKKNSKGLYWLYRFIYISFILLVLLNLSGNYNTSIFLINLFVFASTFVLLFSGVYIYYKIRDFSIIYYLVGWGLYAIMAMIYSLSLLNILPINIISLKAIQIGGALEMIILFLAIVHKIEVLKKEKSRANQRVISLLIKQEEYLQSQNKLLEEGVQNKTRELKKQKEKIENQNLSLRKNREELREKNRKLVETLAKLQETQSQLVNAEKLAVLGQLTAGISHELNNPINFIKSGLAGLKSGMADLLRIFKMYDHLDGRNIKQRLAAIEKEKQAIRYEEMLDLIATVPDHIAIGVNRATDLVKELRSYVHSDKQKEETDINKNIDSSLILLYNEYKYNIEIKKNYSNLPKISCYPGKINQVFINIISNAIDAINVKLKENQNTELTNIICITTTMVKRNNQDYALITIEDNGIGMHDEIRRQIFTPFQTTKSRGRGLGLGLFISESIIKDHNGIIECQSEYMAGTTFNIFLPFSN